MPSTKITASALAGAVTTVFVYLIDLITSTEIPAVVAAAVVVIVSFGLGYVVKETNPAPSAPPAVSPPT